jgi:hypothetical protein
MTSDKDAGKALLDLARREAALREAMPEYVTLRDIERELASRREAERGPAKKFLQK